MQSISLLLGETIGGNTAGINSKEGFWTNLSYSIINDGLEDDKNNSQKTFSHAGGACVIWWAYKK